MALRKGYKKTELGVIPDDWEVRKVNAMGEVRAGKALAANAPGQMRPYLRTKNVYDGLITIDDILFMPMTDGEFELYRLNYGDVLLNEGQSIELVGRCAMYRNEYPAPCAIQNQLIRFRAYERTAPDYAASLFRRCQSTGVFAKVALQTTSVAHLGVSRFANLQLAWPGTKREQEAIAGALSDADAWIESLEHLIAKKRQIKQGAMQELLTGKRRLPGFSGEWTKSTLGDLGRWMGGMTPSMSNCRYWETGDFPWVSSGDVKSTRLTDTSQHITNAAIRESATTVLPSGSIIIVNRSGILRRYLPVSLLKRDMAINQDIKGLILKPEFASEFVLYSVLNAGPMILSTCMKSGTTVESIELNWLKRFEIMMPGQQEQIAIAKVLSELDTEINSLEHKLAKARRIKQGMMQELLTGRIRLV